VYFGDQIRPRRAVHGGSRVWPKLRDIPSKSRSRSCALLEDIAEQIQNLSTTELAEFRRWYAEFDTQAWDTQFEADVKAGKLDNLAESARQTHREGKGTEL
jgi:hypothetical protein